ncbi:hypothetical protein MKZ38_010105 [Zalerion maritima]|uniref:Uncharacterized protein n=1 Tax=Zalerion maritima TaxID=339359 RepID=A0AAD5RG89_9PEZI|nr:hypothetical protein MKZ38_010105 [Zalerion maritima]
MCPWGGFSNYWDDEEPWLWDYLESLLWHGADPGIERRPFWEARGTSYDGSNPPYHIILPDRVQVQESPERDAIIQLIDRNMIFWDGRYWRRKNDISPEVPSLVECWGPLGFLEDEDLVEYERRWFDDGGAHQLYIYDGKNRVILPAASDDRSRSENLGISRMPLPTAMSIVGKHVDDLVEFQGVQSREYVVDDPHLYSDPEEEDDDKEMEPKGLPALPEALPPLLPILP